MPLCVFQFSVKVIYSDYSSKYNTYMLNISHGSKCIFITLSNLRMIFEHIFSYTYIHINHKPKHSNKAQIKKKK